MSGTIVTEFRVPSGVGPGPRRPSYLPGSPSLTLSPTLSVEGLRDFRDRTGEPWV